MLMDYWRFSTFGPGRRVEVYIAAGDDRTPPCGLVEAVKRLEEVLGNSPDPSAPYLIDKMTMYAIPHDATRQWIARTEPF